MKRWLPVLGVVALLAAVWLASTLSSPDVTQLPIPHTSLPDDSATTSTGPGPPIPPIQDGKLPAWVFYLMVAAVGLVVLFILGIVVLLLWSLIRSSALSNKASPRKTTNPTPCSPSKTSRAPSRSSP